MNTPVTLFSHIPDILHVSQPLHTRGLDLPPRPRTSSGTRPPRGLFLPGVWAGSAQPNLTMCLDKNLFYQKVYPKLMLNIFIYIKIYKENNNYFIPVSSMDTS